MKILAPFILFFCLAVQAQIDLWQTTVQENQALVNLQRSSNRGSVSSVELHFQEGSAKAGIDFNPNSIRVEFAPGEDFKTVQLQVIDDGLVENFESFTCTLTNVVNNYLRSEPTQTIWIKDNEIPISFDPTFKRQTFTSDIESLVLDDEGRIYLGILGPAFVRLTKDGVIDPNFHQMDGRPWYGLAWKYHFLPDGKIMAGGKFKNGSLESDSKPVVRLNADGTLDSGYQVVDNGSFPYQQHHFLGFQSDGSALLFYWDSNIYRVDRNGLVDRSFPQISAVAAPAIIVLPDDKFIFIGSTNRLTWDGNEIRRFLPNGQVDTSFKKIKFNSQITSWLFEPDGSFWLAGRFINVLGPGPSSLIKINASGEVVRKAENVQGYIRSMTFAPNGNLLLSGAPEVNQIAGPLILLDAELNYDPSFVSGLRQEVTIQPGPLAVTADDKVIVASSREVARLYPSNSTLSTLEFASNLFVAPEGSNGVVAFSRKGDTTKAARARITPLPGTASNGGDFYFEEMDLQLAPIQASAEISIPLVKDYLIEPDETVELALSNHFAVSPGQINTGRFQIADNNGRPGNYDPGPHGKWDFSRSTVRKMIRHSSGRLIATGSFQIASNVWQGIAGFSQNGHLDTGFTPPSIYWGPDPLAEQKNGQIIIGGPLRTVGGKYTGLFARLNADGTFDPSFAAPDVRGHSSERLAIQSDGKIVAGGYMNVSESFGYSLPRLFSNGDLDRSFRAAQYGYRPPADIVVQPDDKIITGLNPFVARLNADGTIDPSFTPIPYLTGYSLLVPIQLLPDGSVLVSLIGQEEWKLIKTSSNGTIDQQFVERVRPNGAINHILLLRTGMIVIAGTFTEIGGRKRMGLARIDQAGNLDETFDPGIGADAWISTIIELDNSNLLLVGDFWNFNTRSAPHAVEIRTTYRVGLVNLRFENAGAMLVGTMQALPDMRVEVQSSPDLRSWKSEKILLAGEEISLPVTSSANAFLRSRIVEQ